MRSDLKSIIGHNVRTAREFRSRTQEQLAESIERHVDSVSLIERGKTLPSIDTLMSIADALDVKIDVLLTDTDKPSLTDTLKAHDTISRIESLPAHKLDFVTHALDLLDKIPD